ncbi:CotH kinase family protein [bacterium]|nr:CotH kinase family protein [bacterium]
MNRTVVPLILFLGAFLIHGTFFERNKKLDKNSGRTFSTPEIIQENDLYKIRTLYLSILPEDFNFLFSKKPLSLTSFQMAKASINRPSAKKRVKIRIRGSHAWHWQSNKPSFRIRTSSNDQIWNRKFLDLINPEDPTMLVNVIGDFLAQKIGLVASRTRFCRVWVNDLYFGLYHLTDRFDEEFLQTRGIFDSVAIEGNSWKSEMWRNPDLWDVSAINPETHASVRKEIGNLLKLVSPSASFDNVQQLTKSVDFESLASWSAFLTLIGSLHADDFHNQHFIFDEKMKVFSPVVWDSSGFGSLTNTGLKFETEDFEIPLYEYLTPLTNAAFRSHSFHFLRNKCLWILLKNHCNSGLIKNLADKLFDAILSFSKEEKNRGALINIPVLKFPIRLPISLKTQAFSVDSLKRWVDCRFEFIQRSLSSASVCLYPLLEVSGSQAPEFRSFVIEVNGNSPVEWDLGVLSFSVRLDKDKSKTVLSNDPFSSKNLIVYPGLHEVYGKEIPWIQTNARLLNFVLEPASQTYLIGIQRDNFGRVIQVLKEGKNSITGESVSVNIASKSFIPEDLYPLQSCVHPWGDDKLGITN